MPENLLSVLSTACFALAFAVGAPRACEWCGLGILLRVGFFALLRPSELCRILRSHVVLPIDALRGAGPKAILALPDPKTSNVLGRWQFALVTDPLTLEWLTWWCEGLRDADRLFPLSRVSANRLMKELLESMGLSKCGFSLGSLRGGGATARYMAGISIEQFLFQGRWRSVNSLQHYIQEAVASLVIAKLPASAVALGQQLLDLHPKGVRPPLAPWPAWFPSLKDKRVLLARQVARASRNFGHGRSAVEVGGAPELSSSLR